MTKRRSRGEGTIFLDKRGYWVGEITLPGGKEKRKYSKSQKVVREWLLEARKASKDGTLVEGKVTLSEFLARYMRDVAAGSLRPKTIETYNYLIRRHIEPEIGDIPLAALRPEHIQGLYAKKLAAGLSQRTVRFLHSILHKSLKTAMKWGLVARNVADFVDPPSNRKPELTVWSLADVQRFLSAARQKTIASTRSMS